MKFSTSRGFKIKKIMENEKREKPLKLQTLQMGYNNKP